MSRFYITTAIDYVNSRPHLGTAYEKIAADVIARYQRLRGVDTRFMMGNDEHSQNVFQRARELGVEPLAFCDDMERTFRDVWARLDISFDDFIRTTEARHRTGVTTLASRLADAGDVYEGYFEGWYCVSCEAFKTEKDLEDGNCPVHRKPPQWIKEKNHFFRLSKYRQRLLDHYAAHPEFLEPEIRRNEMLRLLESGLDDISMSRTGQAWGIPVPSDPGSVIYVWFDALINYISGVGYGADDALFETWWPADLHVIGKDITRFHCVIWPAMLMSAELPLPRRVFGHGWVHWQGQKMSKSLGTVVDPLEAADRLGPDPLRLYLTKEIAFGQDGDFTWDRFEERYNVDLANNFGNLVSRLASMAHRYRKGRLAAPPSAPGPLAEAAGGAVAAYREAMDAFALHDGHLRGVRAGRRRQRVHRGGRALGHGAGPGARGRARPAVVRRERGGADRSAAAHAGDAELVPRGAGAGRGAGRFRPEPGPRRGLDDAAGRRAAGREGRSALAAARSRPGCVERRDRSATEGLTAEEGGRGEGAGGRRCRHRRPTEGAADDERQ